MRYKDLSLFIPKSVYEPAEDSFMLADATVFLEGEVLEMGCGCGLASLACAKTATNVLSVDINPDAVECSKNNAAKNNVTNVQFIQSDLFSNVQGIFDAIIFNPPYLPTKEKERIGGHLNNAFDGGKDGRKVLDRFLSEFDNYLKPNGVLLLIQSSLNDMEKTTSILEKQNYSVETKEKEDFFFERLYLLKASKK